MVSDLKVFISSKEGELENERLMVKRVIESLLLKPISSEERSATFKSMAETNEKEVRSSDIYIGIFKSEFSPATIREFHIARENMIKPFIFKKRVADSEPRNEELKKFLREIQEPNVGIVTESFTDVFDLGKKVKRAIMKFLADYYLTTNAIEIENPPIAPMNVNDEIDFIDDTVLDDHKKIEVREIRELSDDELIKFGFNISTKFHNSIRIVKVRLPNIIQNETLIEVDVIGTVQKGFLDLFIRDSENNDLWFPDTNTWKIFGDLGMLELKDASKTLTWSFKLPDYVKRNFKVYVLVFEDSDGNTSDKRKVATGVEVVITKT